jgi:hypothetical protein
MTTTRANVVHHLGLLVDLADPGIRRMTLVD